MPSAVLADESSPSAPSVLQRLLMWAGLLIFTAVFILVVHSQREAPGLDMQVYWRAAQILHGQNPTTDYLYAPSLVEAGKIELPFTYPPAAAILFHPLGAMSLESAWSVLKAVNAGLIGVFVGVVLRLAPISRGWFLLRPVPTLLAYATALGLAWHLYPVWFTFIFGQINVLLAVLILADLGRRRSGGAGSGVLTGLAAGLKITPAAMGLVPLVLGRWRTIIGMVLGVLITVLGAAVVLPREVLDYLSLIHI